MVDVTLLLVEDDPSLQEGVRDLLEIADFEYSVAVETASDGLEALSHLKKKTVDLIISDIMMPNMSGLELLEQVRQTPEWVHVPFIFVSAKGRKQDMIEGRLSGAEMYITKPFDSFELIDMIKIQLDRSLETRASQQKEMSSLKREVLQVLNHEFRTPLTYVTAYYEMLASSFSVYQDTENMGDYLRGIRSGCERMSNLVEDMIYVMDVRSGDLYHRYREVGSFCDDALDKFHQLQVNFKGLAEKDRVQTTFNLPAEIPPVFCLEKELFIAFGHLIENAIKFSNYRILKDIQGEVTVTVTADRQHLHLHIQDNGVGLPTGVKDQIFDIFFQHNRERYEQQGSGVGLTIAKGVINAHHGSLELKSAEGQGTEVSVSIPLMPGWPQETRSPDPDMPLENDAIQPRSAHILIVEDEATVREGLYELLRIADTAYQFTIEMAVDGIEGLEKVAARKPDLIISDVMMPKMDGYEFVEKLRQSPDYIQIPVIFLSARTDKKEIMHGRRVGAEEYLTKPYDSEELFSMVTAILNRYFQLKSSADKDFEQLKLNILGMLRPDFLGSLEDVDNYSSLMAGGSADLNTSSDLRDALRGIQVGSQRISELVEDFITLAEIQTGEAQSIIENRPQPFGEISILIDQLIKTFTGRESTDVKYQLLCGESGMSVVVDLGGLERALKRLIGVTEVNCLKGGGHTVYIEVEEVNADLEIHIWHDGENLDPSTARLIEAILMNQSSGWDHPEAKELVYGPRLMIARYLIEKNRGRVKFVSGRGADGSLTSDAFSIYFPLVSPAAG